MRAHLSTVKKYNITWIDCLVGAWQRYANLMALPAVFDCWNRDIADLLPTRNLEIKFGDKPVVLGRCTNLLRHRGENAGNICGDIRTTIAKQKQARKPKKNTLRYWRRGCLRL